MDISRLWLSRRRLIELLVVVSALTMLLALSQDWLWGLRRSWVADKILASYREKATRGEVVPPSTNSDSLRCGSMCGWSLPYDVTVKTGEGSTLYYFAERKTNSEGWSFKFSGGTDINGNWFTNSPSYFSHK